MPCPPRCGRGRRRVRARCHSVRQLENRPRVPRETMQTGWDPSLFPAASCPVGLRPPFRTNPRVRPLRRSGSPRGQGARGGVTRWRAGERRSTASSSKLAGAGGARKPPGRHISGAAAPRWPSRASSGVSSSSSSSSVRAAPEIEGDGHGWVPPRVRVRDRRGGSVHRSAFDVKGSTARFHVKSSSFPPVVFIRCPPKGTGPPAPPPFHCGNGG